MIRYSCAPVLLAALTLGACVNGTAAAPGSGLSGSTLPKRVLLYDFNSTPTIPTTPQQLTYLQNQLATWGYESVVSRLPADITVANLATFGAVAMINTCFEPFGRGQMGTAETAALRAFVEAGGGLFGTHCASVTFQSAQPPNPYNDLLGGRAGKDNFDGKSVCVTTAESHVSTERAHATVVEPMTSSPDAFNLYPEHVLEPGGTVSAEFLLEWQPS